MDQWPGHQSGAATQGDQRVHRSRDHSLCGEESAGAKGEETKLEGRIWKDEKTKYLVVDVPLLDISTQGRSRKQALAMIEDAIPIEAEKEALRIQAQPSREPGVFTVSASDPDSLIALLLKRQRTCRGLRAYGTWHAGSRPVRQRLTHSMNRANAPPHSENCGSCCTPSIPNWKPSSRPDNSLTLQTNLSSIPFSILVYWGGLLVAPASRWPNCRRDGGATIQKL